MELVTIQTITAFKDLISKGYLSADTKYLNTKKYGRVYKWLEDFMNKSIDNDEKKQYPIWAWYKYGKIKCPPKNRLRGYFGNDDVIVKITFSKEDKDILLTNFEMYEKYPLHAEFYYRNDKEKTDWEKECNEYNITKEDFINNIREDKGFLRMRDKLLESWEVVVDKRGEYTQATLWKISIKDIKKVEFIKLSDKIKGRANRKI